MANYTPSLIIPLSRLFQTSPKNTEGTREEEEEGEREGGGRRTRERKGRKWNERKSLREYLRSDITHGAPLEKVF